MKKNVTWHILAPRRGCFGNHLPLRRVRILAERFFIVRKRSFLTIKKRYLIPKGTGYPAVPPQLTCTLHVRSASVNAGSTLPYWGKAPRVGSKCSAQLLPPLQPLWSALPSLLFLFCASFLSVIDDKKILRICQPENEKTRKNHFLIFARPSFPSKKQAKQYIYPTNSLSPHKFPTCSACFLCRFRQWIRLLKRFM